MTRKQLKAIADKHLDQFDLNEGVFPAIMKALEEVDRKSRVVTDRQKRHIAKIIESECGWMINWCGVSERSKQEALIKTALKIANYLNKPKTKRR